MKTFDLQDDVFGAREPIDVARVPFIHLRTLAARMPEQLAMHSARHRLVTFRKLWSRIERATARLQHEWQVMPGDTVAYCGRAHPDALILYFGLLRCGAKFLPIEREDLRPVAAEIAARHGAVLLVREDELAAESAATGLRSEPLLGLILHRCPHEPVRIIEDATLPGLIRAADASDAVRVEEYALADLSMGEAAPGLDHFDSGSMLVIGAELFDSLTLPAVLARLSAGKTVSFDGESPHPA